MHFPDLEIHRLEFFDFDLSRQVVERDGEESLPSARSESRAGRAVPS